MFIYPSLIFDPLPSHEHSWLLHKYVDFHPMRRTENRFLTFSNANAAEKET